MPHDGLAVLALLHARLGAHKPGLLEGGLHAASKVDSGLGSPLGHPNMLGLHHVLHYMLLGHGSPMVDHLRLPVVLLSVEDHPRVMLRVHCDNLRVNCCFLPHLRVLVLELT